jgi:hypothetical protein
MGSPLLPVREVWEDVTLLSKRFVSNASGD